MPFYRKHRYSERERRVRREKGHDICSLGSLLLGSQLGPVGSDSLEAKLDALYRASRATRLTLQEEQSRLLLENGVGRSAGVARKIYIYIIYIIYSQTL